MNTWKFKIGELWKQGLTSLDFDQKADFQLEKTDEINISKPVEIDFSVKILEDNDLFLTINYLETEVGVNCQRCLKKYKSKIEVENSFGLYTPKLNPEKIGEDYHEYDFGRKELDLSPVLQEEILLNVPLIKLCKKSCKGICPKCGKNLNTGKCKCKIEEKQPEENKPFKDLDKLL